LRAFFALEPDPEMNKLIFANLLHRPLRSIISVLAVAIEVIMILSIVGIFMGMLNDQKQRTNGIGADLMVWPSKASYMNGVGGAPMPASLAGYLSKQPHVAVASPAIQQLVTSPSVEVIDGIDYSSFNALRPFVFQSGGPFQSKYDVIVDDVFAAGKNPSTGESYRVGDVITVFNHPFRIAGIVDHGKGARKLLPIGTMGDLIGSPGKVSLFYIKCDNPANQDAVIQEIHSSPGLGGYNIQTMEEWNSLMTPDRIPGFNIALNVITCIAVIIGFLVIFQSMYTAVLERTREIGILKSMGASKVTIVSMVVRECAALALAGVVVGIAGAYGVRFLILYLFPTQHFEITVHWMLWGALIAFSGSLFGAFYPAWMAARKDPIDALAYE
jgi:putative ABC transport system permease protein